MVTKKEGATMTCTSCDTDLICRLKDYGGKFTPSLQWQNHDGSAHYKTSDGRNFTCNIPDEQNQPDTSLLIQSTPLSQIPSLEEEMKKIVEGEALTLLMIRQTVVEFLKKFTQRPGLEIVQLITQIIYDKHFKSNFQKGSEIEPSSM